MKSKIKNKYFVYAYAYDLDEEMPPFMGRVSYDEFDDIEKAKQATMTTELSRFAGFEIVVLQVKGPKNKLDDPEDYIHSITINQARTPKHKEKLNQYFQSLAQDQIEEEAKTPKKKCIGCK